MNETSSKAVITQGIEKDTRIPLANHFKEIETKTLAITINFILETQMTFTFLQDRFATLYITVKKTA